MALAQYHVDSWSTDNGLPQNIIRAVCQTPEGYLWMATMDGLVRFDGARFVVFNRSNTPGILGNRYTSLYCTRSGELWAGTESTGVTRYRQGGFITYTSQQGLPSNSVDGIARDNAGHIWALSSASIAQWDEGKSRFIEMRSERSKYNYYLSSDEQSGFWGIDGHTLRLFIQGHVNEYPLPRDWPGRIFTSAGRDLNGVIWLAAPDGSLAKLSGGRWSKVLRKSGSATNLPAAADVSSTYRDARGNLWNIAVASDPVLGLLTYLILPSGGRTEKIGFNSFFEDGEGSVWLATNGQGLYRVRKQAISVLSKEEGLPDRNVYTIYQDRAGAIWMGTWSGGLVQVSKTKIKTFSTAEGLLLRRISSICEDRDGVLWVATPAGLQRLRNGRFESVWNEGFGVDVRAIHQDAEGTLWLGTGQGLVRHSDRGWSVVSARDGLASDDVRVIIDGRAGNLWIGGYGGLTSFDHGQLKRWTEADGLPSNTVRALYEDTDGVLWIGTYDGGLGRLKDGKFTRYTTREGLFNNGVFQILEGSRGYLWMSCNRGIYRVSKQQLNDLAAGKRATITSIAYGKGDGMRNAECNGGLSPAGIRARDGKLWFPTQDGAAVIDPVAVATNPVPPPVVIESVLLDHEPRPLDRALRVSPGNENLEIEYTALSFINSGQIRFRYRLEDLDRDWVEANTRRTAYYSHLPPGRYRFQVIAANSDGVWNLAGKSIAIIVLPPYYRTWWFLALAVLTAAGAVVLAWNYRMAQLQRVVALQHTFTRELMASQESERKRIAAELHDSLGQELLIIKNWAALALGAVRSTDTAIREPLAEISSTASQAIDGVREIAYNLRPYQLEKLGLSTGIQDLINQVAASSSARLTAEIDPLDGLFRPEVEISIYRIVQEGLNNIVRHSHASAARILVKHEAGMVKLTIEDNGCGFNLQGKQAERGRKGFGLLGITERVAMMGGQVAIQSAPGAGSTLNIWLRPHQEALP